MNQNTMDSDDDYVPGGPDYAVPKKKRKITKIKKIDQREVQVADGDVDYQPHEDDTDSDDSPKRDLEDIAIPNPILEDDKYKCPYCEDETFETETEFISHLAQIHEEDDDTCVTYECLPCSQEFDKRVELIRHVFFSFDHWDGVANFLCTTCGWLCRRKESMIQHKKRFHSQNPFVCPVCKCQTEGSWKTFTEHLETEHTIFPDTLCEFCGEVFIMKFDLEQHLEEIHFVDRFSCRMCFMRFRRQHDLKEHIETEHTEANKYKCLVCPTYLASNRLRLQHTRFIHALEIPDQDPETARRYFDVNNKTSDFGNRMECDKCGLGFDNLMKYIKHSDKCKQLRMAPLVANETTVEKKKASGGLETVAPGDGPLTIKCPTCRIVFPADKFNNEHFYNCGFEDDGNKFKCEECGKTFMYMSSLSRHIAWNHNSEMRRAFRCEHCGKLFRHNYALRQHIEFVHLKIRHLKCPFCGKGFYKPAHKKEHMFRVHPEQMEVLKEQDDNGVKAM